VGVIRAWGTTQTELRRRLPCDDVVAEPDAVLDRAVDVHAPEALTWRWLCQLRVAPYSYDWIDNRGRRSPRSLTPGLEQLEVGQRFASVFTLVAFEPDRSITMLSSTRRFGECAMGYDVREQRLHLRLVLHWPPRSPLRRPMSALLPAGDLVMARKQLLTLKRLAESSAEAGH
jgi:hypothetical protein